MILHSPAIDIVVQIVEGEHFYRQAHRLVFDALVYMKEARKEIDLVQPSPADFARQMAEPSSFLSAVMRQPKASVKGDEDALRRLAGSLHGR